mgnify:CR=1 FL=1
MDKINPYPITSSLEELKNDNKIIQKAHFIKNINDEKFKNEQISNNRIKCMICGKEYTKYNKTKHYKTKHHIFCEKLNYKWRKMIINI